MVYSEPVDILATTWREILASQSELTEQELIDLIERVYQGFEMAAHKEFVAIQTATIECQRRMAGVFDNPRPFEDDENGELKTRLEKYKQVSVIPSTHASEALATFEKNPRLLRNFEVKLPYWYFSQFRDVSPDWNALPIPVCKVEYDEKAGVIFLDNEPESETPIL